MPKVYLTNSRKHMPIIKSAKKQARQAVKRTKQHVAIKKDIKTTSKALKAKPTTASLAKAQSELDKAVKKGLIKKNTASRRKSSLYKLAKAAGVKLTVLKTKKPAAPKVEKTAAPKAAKPATKKPAAKKPVAKKAAAKK